MNRFVFVLFVLSLAACSKPAPYESKAMEIFPPMTIRHAALFRMDELGITQDFFSGHWTAVMFASTDCEADCQHRLAVLNAFNAGQALLVFTDVAGHQQMRALKNSYPKVEISMGATAASLDLFIEQFNDSAIGTQQRAQYIYLVNPESVLTYAALASQLQVGDLDLEVQAFADDG
jgi:hypothetical protein